MKRISFEPRENWKSHAESHGFLFHTMYGEPYWDESKVYQFTLKEIENNIEDPSQDLHIMCLDLIPDLLTEENLKRLGIPESQWDNIKNSWDNRYGISNTSGIKSLYGRFDLAYTGYGPAKLLEYNADTPTSLYEAAYYQWMWLEDCINLGKLPDYTDQFNSIQETLINAFAQHNWGEIFHFSACRDSLEDQSTVFYMMDCAQQAGQNAKFTAIEDIGYAENGHFVDHDSHEIHKLFKLYPWEMILSDSYGELLSSTKTKFYEPLWKSLLSNKGLLPFLWKKYKNHPNLLPAYFFDDPNKDDLDEITVVKPLFSREGANVKIQNGSTIVCETTGDYGHHPTIIQSYTPLAKYDDSHMVIGSWIVDNMACGIGIREDQSLITKDLSRFIPHIILD